MIQVTEMMLAAAFEEAVAAGLFHRRSNPLSEHADKQVLLLVLNAALSCAPSASREEDKVDIASSSA
jgi:hypothetical protein